MGHMWNGYATLLPTHRGDLLNCGRWWHAFLLMCSVEEDRLEVDNLTAAGAGAGAGTTIKSVE